MRHATFLMAPLLLLASCAQRFVPNYRVMEEFSRVVAAQESAALPYLRCRSGLPMLDKVVLRFAKATNMRNWCVHVLANPQWQAFVTADRHVVVFAGLLQDLKSEDELAAVVGHEMGHAAFRHVEQKRVLAHDLQGLVGLATTSADNIYEARQNAQTSAALLELIVTNPFTQVQEYQADVFGIYTLKKMGYDPAAAITVWFRQMKLSRDHQINTPLTTTHPISRERVTMMMRALASFYESR